MAISWRVAALALLGVPLLVFFPQRSTLLGWLVIVAAVTIIDALAAVNPRSFTYSRSVESPIRADQSTTSTVEVTSPSPRGARIDLRDAWVPSVHPTPYQHSGKIAQGFPFVAQTMLSPERRGVQVGQWVSIRVWGPLGLGARQISVDIPSTLDVLPEFRSRRLLPSRLARLQELEGSSAVILRGPGTEFDSLRDYVRGDDPRDIDWKASARSTSLVVRTWQPERDRHVLVLLDTGRSSALVLGSNGTSHAAAGSDATRSDAMGAGTIGSGAAGTAQVEDPDLLDLGEAPRLDAGIETALLMAGLCDRAGDNVHVVALDRVVRARVSKVKGSELMSSLARAFRSIVPALEPIDWTLAEAEVNRLLRHRSLVVLVTQVPEAGADPELTEIITRMRRTHTVIVASAQDPTLSQMATERGSLDALSAAGSAADQLHASAMGAADLQRIGAHVVSVDAGLLAARTADVYIELKKRGIL